MRMPVLIVYGDECGVDEERNSGIVKIIRRERERERERDRGKEGEAVEIGEKSMSKTV